MAELEHWLRERLMPLDEATFIQLSGGRSVSHRRVPEACRKSAQVSYFSVPLASGTGAALLAEPLKIKSDSPPVLVILFHGMGDDCTYPHWHWIEALTARGLSVLSVDWDGHGVVGGSVLDMQSAVRSLPLILQKIYGEPGAAHLDKLRAGPRCFLMGHSTGAALALLSVTRPELSRLVMGLVVISPAVVVNADSDMKREALTYLRPSTWWRDLFGKIPYYGIAGLVPAFGRFRRSQFPIRLKVGIPYADQVRLFVHETFEVRRVLRNVQVPVLWLHGTRDKIVPLTHAAKLMGEIPSAKFLHIDDSRGHLEMAFSQEIPTYAAKFIETCTQLKAQGNPVSLPVVPFSGASAAGSSHNLLSESGASASGL